MSLKDDLIAAKAMIDTPEAFYRLGIVGAFNSALHDKTLYGKGVSLLRKSGAGEAVLYHDPERRYQTALKVFDRAIEAAS